MNTYFVVVDKFTTSIETVEGKTVMRFTSDFAFMAPVICQKLNDDELIDNEMSTFYAEELRHEL